MAGTKTGTGGFEIDGKTHDFDVGDPNAPGLEPTTADHGDINVDDSVKDISKKTRSTLGKYLSDVTKGKQGPTKGVSNRFTIDPPNDPGVPDETNVSDEKGLPAPITPTRNSEHFASPVDSSHPQGTNGTVFDSPDLRQSSGPVPDPTTTLSTLGKGKQGKSIDGHDLLHSVGKDNTPEPIETYRATVLTTNRFTADRVLSTDLSYRIGGRTYNSSQLKQVGVMLSLRGSQEFPAAFNDTVNPVNAGSVAGAILPSPNQTGILKVPVRILEAKDALEHLANTNDEPTTFEISPLGNQSWGSLNNVEEPWAGLLNIGMVGMALAMQAAMLLAFEGLGSLIGLVGGGSTPPSTARRPDGTYVMGSYLATPLANPNNVGMPPDIMSLLGLHGTRFPFGDALKVGASAFFVGAKKAKEGIGSQLLGALTSAAEATLSDNSSAGFLIIVSRLIIRTGQQVAADVSKIGEAFSSNPLSGVKSIVSLLDNLRHSKLIAAMNIFSTLGDAILSEDEFSKDVNGDPDDPRRIISNIDAVEDSSPGANVKKSRLKRSSNKTKLAWASNRAPSSYLIPDSIATMTLADVKLGSFKGPFGLQDADSRSVLFLQTDGDRQQSGARIPRQSTDPEGIDVKKVESLLEAEYMPFYFHDLRTNEIIGFQAFLASLTDDYTASWETVDGYGRVDPIKIYKSTARRIGMSFYVIATDEKDFDEMWVKLNKLVTLVYPQYTKGRTLTDGTNMSFVQPFSQLIGASPLIRIRLGDLIRSNYSRFALARLFGAADGDMKLDGQDIKFEGAQGIIKDPMVAKQVLDVINNAQADSSNTYSLATAGWASAMEPAGSSIPVGMSGPSTPDQAPSMKIDEGDLGFFDFKIKKTLGNGMVAVEPTLVLISDLVEFYGFSTDAATSLRSSLNDRYNNREKNPGATVIGGESGYAVPFHALRLSPRTLRKVFADKPSITEAIQNIDQLSSFLDIEKNALVKSFRAVQGKGLGGVIETMNFDWYDNVMWDIRPDHRAPKMCKVSIAFVPIHDVSPGLDHLGYNRAPIYSVGGAMGMGFDPDKSE